MDHLGPGAEACFASAAALARVLARLRAGEDFADAVLGVAWSEIRSRRGDDAADPRLSEELLAFFARPLLRRGGIPLAPALDRFLEDGDLGRALLGERADAFFRDRFAGRRAATERLAFLLDRRDRAAGRDGMSSGGGAGGVFQRPAYRLALVVPRLRPPDREILRWTLAGRRPEQIAEELGLSESAARRAVARVGRRAEKMARAAWEWDLDGSAPEVP